MIGYAPHGSNHRVGFVEAAAFGGESFTELMLDYAETTVKGATAFTTDPVTGDPGAILATLGAGDRVYILAHMSDNDVWAYIEIQDFFSGQPARGFVERSQLN